MKNEQSRVKLTDSLIASTPPQDKYFVLIDTEVPGLQCFINPKGKKSFKLRVRGFQKEIGQHPLMKCADARKTALIWRGELLSGKVPVKQKVEKAQEIAEKEISLNDLIAEYLEYKKSGANALMPTTHYDYSWTWKKYIHNTLGKKSLVKINDKDINIYFVSLKETYSHIKTSRIIIKTALEYAENMGYDVPSLRPEKWIKFKTKKKERYFTAGEFLRLWAKLNQLEEKKGIWETQKKLITVLKLLMYTGCRCGEILNLKWNDLFLEEGYIQLWKTKTKKGRIIPIVPFIHDLIIKIPKIYEEPYVFSSIKRSQKSLAYTSLITLWLSLMKEGEFNSEETERLTIHSLRHTYITAANRSGISPWTIATLVGHTLGNSITGLYIHHNLAELKKAQEKIVDTLFCGSY